MKNEDKVYLYSDGSMCRVINENDKAVKQVDPFIVRQNLKLLGSCYEDNGTYFVLKDDNNRIYYMSQDDFNKYVEKHDIMLDSEFEFMRDGKTQSIREIETNDKWIPIKDKIPELELQQWKDKIIQISKAVKVKKNNGTICVAKYVFSIVDSKSPFPRLYWEFCGYTGNEVVELKMNKDDCWKEIEE